MNRDDFVELLNQKVLNKNLVNHCLAVEAIMSRLAEYFNEDIEKWGLTGLLHDIDYENTKDNPKKHGIESIDILANYNLPEEMLNAIKCHNEMLGFERKTLLDKALFCADQLSGLIVASTLVLPSKKINDLTTKSVLKKFKEKSFARGAKRENILLCETDLGLKLDEFVDLSLKAMQKINNKIGL